jgi:uncharacterized protein (TIGR00369 family)
MLMATEALQSHLAQIPLFRTLQLRLGGVGEGTASLTAPFDPAYKNAFCRFHGGLLTTLADTAAYVAVLALVGSDALITTTDMNIRFLAPCNTDATAEARVIKFGKTLCPVLVDVPDFLGW